MPRSAGRGMWEAEGGRCGRCAVSGKQRDVGGRGGKGWEAHIGWQAEGWEQCVGREAKGCGRQGTMCGSCSEGRRHPIDSKMCSGW